MKIIDIECWSRDKYESDFRSNENYSSSSENKLWKKSGRYGIWNHGFCDTGAVLYQLSQQANWELVIMLVRREPVNCFWNLLVKHGFQQYFFPPLVKLNTAVIIIDI